MNLVGNTRKALFGTDIINKISQPPYSTTSDEDDRLFFNSALVGRVPDTIKEDETILT